MLRYGVTYWNYVGEPVHYVLGAIEREYGGDEARILRRGGAAIRSNRFRYAVGNGAAAPTSSASRRWLGLEDMFELYGSTEAAISTFRKKGDPRGSVGEITDAAVKILNERGEECPPAELDADGKITNYAEPPSARSAAARRTRASSRATSTTPTRTARSTATASTTRATSATCWCATASDTSSSTAAPTTGSARTARTSPRSQVARHIQEHPDVVLAAAYGVPCSVSDELVMAALKLRAGATLRSRRSSSTSASAR